MDNTNTEHFDNVLKVTEEIKDHFWTVGSNTPLASVSYHIIELIKRNYDDIWKKKNLNKEIRNRFISLPESRLQDRFANYLISNIKLLLMPFYSDISSVREDLEYPPHDTDNIYSGINYMELRNTENLLHSWLWIIINNIKVFAPEVYEEHKQYLIIKEYDEFGDEVYSEQLKSENSDKPIFKKLPPKVLLLEKLGFFKLPCVLRLNWESKGKLVSALCGGNADNAVDYIRSCDPDRLALQNNPYRNAQNVKAVEDLLDSLR